MTTSDNPTPRRVHAPDVAVRDLLAPRTPPEAVLALEPEDLDGYSIDDLADYLDAGMDPKDPVIEISPACQIALSALRRLRTLTRTFLDDEAAAEGPAEEGWISSLIHSFTLDSRSGRQIPYRSTNNRADLRITEGAVRGLVRAAGDRVEGILVGRSHLTGDVTTPHAPIIIEVEATIIWRRSIPDAAAQLRDAVKDALALHTELNVTRVTVTVTDVHVAASEGHR